MIDLHLHLDGSISPEYLLHQAQQDHISLPGSTVEELLPYLTVGNECPDLTTYLKKFDLILTVMQTESSLDNAVYDLLGRLSKQKLTHAEIRFAPQLHCQNGLVQEAVVEAAINGLSRGIKDFPIKAGLILCTMRMGDNQTANLKTVDMVHKYLNQGVIALDLAGAEALFPTHNFESVFSKASKLDLPYTIHAGEGAGPESIRQALKLGAQRIGHGVRCIEDPDLVELLLQKQIPLEVCPVSNIHTKMFEDIAHHPILTLLRHGLCVTLNTDNMTISNTWLEKEFSLLRSEQNLSSAEEKQLNENSLKATFL